MQTQSTMYPSNELFTASPNQPLRLQSLGNLSSFLIFHPVDKDLKMLCLQSTLDDLFVLDQSKTHMFGHIQSLSKSSNMPNTLRMLRASTLIRTAQSSPDYSGMKIGLNATWLELIMMVPYYKLYLIGMPEFDFANTCLQGIQHF